MVINMIVLATMHDDKYKELADETWEGNKVQYAEKHGYAYLAKTEDFYGFEPGFEKIQFILIIVHCRYYYHVNHHLKLIGFLAFLLRV
jgi:hypothetical protein